MENSIQQKLDALKQLRQSKQQEVEPRTDLSMVNSLPVKPTSHLPTSLNKQHHDRLLQTRVKEQTVIELPKEATYPQEGGTPFYDYYFGKSTTEFEQATGISWIDYELYIEYRQHYQLEADYCLAIQNGSIKGKLKKRRDQ